jgi:hypothetical protein
LNVIPGEGLFEKLVKVNQDLNDGVPMEFCWRKSKREMGSNPFS